VTLHAAQLKESRTWVRVLSGNSFIFATYRHVRPWGAGVIQHLSVALTVTAELRADPIAASSPPSAAPLSTHRKNAISSSLDSEADTAARSRSLGCRIVSLPEALTAQLLCTFRWRCMLRPCGLPWIPGAPA
jgi:hypothetical protein